MAGSKGVWLDTKTGKVVEAQPEEGVQLVAPGVEATPGELAVVERYKAEAPAEAKASKSTK